MDGSSLPSSAAKASCFRRKPSFSCLELCCSRSEFRVSVFGGQIGPSRIPRHAPLWPQLASCIAALRASFSFMVCDPRFRNRCRGL